MFGFPTGVGALLVRKEALRGLTRPAFSGGTVEVVDAATPGLFLLRDGHAGFEDGTLNYLDIPAVKLGLQYLLRITMTSIHQRVMALTEWLLTELTGLRHRTGRSVVLLYGPANGISRGGTVALNLLTPCGKFVDHSKIQQACDRAKISLRYWLQSSEGASGKKKPHQYNQTR
eukprot:RCo027866